MSGSKRVNQVADLIQREIAQIMAQTYRLHNPLLHGISVTKVKLSPDLKLAKIYYLIQDEAQLPEVDAALDSSQSFLRCLLAERVHLRYVPKIRFVFDEMVPRAARIHKLLEDTPLDTVADIATADEE